MVSRGWSLLLLTLVLPGSVIVQAQMGVTPPLFALARVEVPLSGRSGADALARLTTILEQSGGVRIDRLDLPWTTDLFAYAGAVHVMAVHALPTDTVISLTCLSWGLEPSAARAEARCQAVLDAYNGPDY